MAECRKCKYYEHRSKTRTGFCRNKKSNWYGLIVRGGKKAPDYCFRRVKEEAASVPYIEQRMKQISDDELIQLVYDIIESYEAMKLLCLDCSREEISALIAEAVLAANAGK